MGIITKSWLLLHFALILNHSFMLSLVVISTLIALPGDKSLQPVINVHFSLYADVNGFLNPSIITGENYRPDLLFQIRSNLNNNAVCKKEKYLNLIKEMSRNYRFMTFVTLSVSFLGVFSDEYSTFLDMMNDTGMDKKQQLYIIK